MMTQTSDWSVVMERLEKLEKQNRGLKQAGAVALIVVAAILLMGQAATKKTVEANEFILKDASGKVRAKLFMKEGPDLVFYDSNGKDLAWLGVHPLLGPTLSFYSANGKSGPLRDGLAIDLNQTGLAIFDDSGFETRIGSTDLITAATGETHTTSAASVILFNKDKKVLWKAP